MYCQPVVKMAESTVIVNKMALLALGHIRQMAQNIMEY